MMMPTAPPLRLRDVGLEVPLIIDARPNANGPLAAKARALGIRVTTGRAIVKVKGGRRVTGVSIGLQAGEGAVLEEVACDAVAMSGGWSPVVHLFSHCGGKLIWDDAAAHFRPDPQRPPLNQQGEAMVYAAGAANGALGAADALEDATLAAINALKAMGFAARAKAPQAESEAEAQIEPVWIMPQGAGPKLRMKMWLDYQNDVKVSDVQLAAREGYTRASSIPSVTPRWAWLQIRESCPISMAWPCLPRR